MQTPINLIPLERSPALIYLLPYVHAGVPLNLACAPDGGLLRSQFIGGQRTLATLAATCLKFWPLAELEDAPAGFLPDIGRGYLYGTPFQQAVWQHLALIKPGKTLSYGQLATAIGKPDACRAVGAAVGANPYAPFVACHRILAANGKIGGFAGGTELKRQLLQTEGISAAY